MDFIKNFNQDVVSLDTTAEFTPRIVTWACTSCDSELKKKECVSNGKYCAMNHKGTYVQGKDIIMEDLREKCLHTLLKEDKAVNKWWDYMAYVHKMCYEEVNEDCSKMGHKSIGREYQKTVDCVTSSFEGSNPVKDDNRILRAESEAWKEYGTAYWPSVVINDRTYRGDLVPDAVFNAICAGFNDEPSACTNFKIEAGIVKEPEGITGNALIIVVVVLVLVNLLLIWAYRRCTNKEIKDDMQLQVNSAVS